MYIRKMPRRGSRTLNLDDIPGTREKIEAGSDVTAELQELFQEAQNARYSRVRITGCPWRPARVTVTYSAGAITGATIHDGGWFPRAPVVTLSGGGGTGGGLTPIMTGNTISGFTPTAGSGYVSAPTATFRLNNYIRYNGKLSIPAGLRVASNADALLQYTGTANEAHIEIGHEGLPNERIDIQLFTARETFSSWNDATQNNDCGILLHNPYYGHAEFSADGFTIPVEIRSTAHPAAYFDVDLGLLRSGRYDLLLHKANDNNAWFNQVSYRGSRGSFNSDSGSKARCGYVAGVKYPVGVRLWSENETHPFNNQTFYDCCFEIAPSVADPWPESVPVQIEGDCLDLKFLGGTRHENQNVEFFRHKSGNARAIQLDLSNYTDGTWALADMWNSEAGQNRFDLVTINDNRRQGTQPKQKFISQNLGQFANQYDSAGRIYVPGGWWQNPSDNTKRKSSVGSSNAIGTDYIEIINTDAFAVHVLNNNCRMLAFKPIIKSGAAFCRQHFVGWNAGRTIRYSPAFATATQSGGAIATKAVLQGGYFTVAPTVNVTGSGGGSGAVLTPVGPFPGPLTDLTITSGGSLYAGTITVTVVPNEKDWIQGNVFQRSGANFYGSYLDNVGNDTGYTLWLRPEVKETSYYIRGGGGTVQLMGYIIESLDGNPFTVVSWHGGMYSDPTKRFINYAPSGTIKGNLSPGDLLYNDAAAASGDAWGYRYRSGPAYDSCVP